MRLRTMLAALIVAAPIFAQLAALAAVAGAEDRPVDLKRTDPVVITANKLDTPVSQIAASVSVVTDDDMKLYLYPTVDEALRGLPGVDVRRSGSFGKSSAISIRGANGNQVQVLVDGVRVKSPTLGLADLSDISPDLVDRIEVIRGPQSTLYGADAIGGVVNIITKKGSGAPFAGTLESEGGNYDTWRVRGTGSGQWKLLDYALSGSRLETNGQFQNDSAAQTALNGRVGLTLPWNSRLDFVARWNRTDTGLAVKFVCCDPLPEVPLIDHNAAQQSESLTLSLSGSTRPVDWWESRARLSLYKQSQGFQDPEDFGYDFDFPQFSQIDIERREAEWVNAFHIGTWSTSTIGFEYRREEGRNRNNFETFRAHYDTGAFFFEQQFRFFDRLFLNAGVRVEDNSTFGTATTERGGLVYAVKEWGTRLHGSAGSGFRAPTLNDLFFPGFSNPDLQPEHSFSWDVGIDQRLWKDRIRLGATYFHNDFDDLIKFISIPVFPFSAVVNVAKARTQGVEATAEVDILHNLVAAASYTYTDAEDLTTGLPLPREPRHRGAVTVTWEPLPRLSLWVKVYVASRQFESREAGYNAGYTRVDAGGVYRLIDRCGPLASLELTARVQNVLNESYSEVRGFPALGTQFLLGARANF